MYKNSTETAIKGNHPDNCPTNWSAPVEAMDECGTEREGWKALWVVYSVYSCLMMIMN